MKKKNSKKRHPTVSPSASLIYPIRYRRSPMRYFCRADSFAIHGLPRVVLRPAASGACFLLPPPCPRTPLSPHCLRRGPPCCCPMRTRSAVLVGRAEVAFPPPLCFSAAAAARRNLRAPVHLGSIPSVASSSSSPSTDFLPRQDLSSARDAVLCSSAISIAAGEELRGETSSLVIFEQH